MREELSDSDPTSLIIRPSSVGPFPGRSQTRICRTPSGWLCHRCAPILLLAAFAGLRVAEIAGLERDDVIETKGLIRVRHGKGDKERILPLHPDVLAALRVLPMPRNGPIFVRPRGGKFPPNRMGVVISRYLRELGIDATGHQLRHWFATVVYARGHDIRVTQELLGHSDPSTTAGYISYSHVDAAAAVAALRLPGPAVA